MSWSTLLAKAACILGCVLISTSSAAALAETPTPRNSMVLSQQHRITETKRDAGAPAIAWHNGRFIVAWHDRRQEVDQVYFTLLDGNGAKLLDDTLVSDHDDQMPSRNASILLEGVNFSITYLYNGLLQKTTFSSTGEQISAESHFAAENMRTCRVLGLEGDTALSWTDKYTNRTRMNFGVLKPDSLTLTDTDQHALSSGATWVTTSSLARAGETIGVAWADNPEGLYQIYLASFDLAGNPVSAPAKISQSTEKAYAPFIASSGQQFSVTWYDERHGNAEIYFASLANHAEVTELRITEAGGRAYHPVLAWNGDSWGLAWYDYRHGNSEIYFSTLAGEGGRLTDDLRLTKSAKNSISPALVWADDKFGLVWLDDRHDDNFEVYFMTLTP